MSLSRYLVTQHACFFLALSSLVTPLTISVSAQTPEQLNDAFKAFKFSPSWINLNVKTDGPRLIFALENFRGWPAASVRDVLVAIMDDPTVMKDHDLDIRSKIYVLNRYYFNVPRRIKDGLLILRFGAWAQPDHGDLLYPLTQDSPGRFRILNGYTDPYSGPAYDGLAEFDYFYLRFNLRFPVKIVAPQPAIPSAFQLH